MVEQSSAERCRILTSTSDVPELEDIQELTHKVIYHDPWAHITSASLSPFVLSRLENQCVFSLKIVVDHSTLCSF